jgi:hypothetical protein
VAKLIADGFDFDVIDAHYYYPDGVAAAILASWFGKPFVITARGSDLTLLPEYPCPGAGSSGPSPALRRPSVCAVT